jgi:hypothetical protein
MRMITIFLFISICFSCRKKEIIWQADIHYEFNDDVSPVVGKFSLPGDYDYISWSFEGKLSTDYDSNPSHYTFGNEGIASVEVTAIKNMSFEKFIGKSEFTIPGPAKKLKINGFYSKNLESNPFNQKQILVSITYLRLGTTNTNNISFNPAEYSGPDTIFFSDPIIFDISGFEENSDYDHDMVISIYFDGENNFVYRSNFNLTLYNRIERTWHPNYLQLFNVTDNNIDQLYFLCDWMPN